MITSLAPLGATHNIVLVLAYGALPAGDAAAASARHVTVTASLKPKADKHGESKTLQFEGPAGDVQATLETELPLAVQKLVQHVSTLDQLEAQLKEEQATAQKEKEDKKSSGATTTRSGVKSTTKYPNTASSPKPAEPEKEKPAAKKPAAPAPKATGAAAEALAKVRAAAEKGKAAAESGASTIVMGGVPAAAPATTVAEARAAEAGVAIVASEAPAEQVDTAAAPSLEDLAKRFDESAVAL